MQQFYAVTVSLKSAILKVFFFKNPKI